MLSKIREGWGLGEEFNNEGDVESSFKEDVGTASGALGVLIGKRGSCRCY